MITTVKDFIIRVEALADKSDAYYLFEDECSEQVRDAVYQLAEIDNPEPFRSAMSVIGFEV